MAKKANTKKQKKKTPLFWRLLKFGILLSIWGGIVITAIVFWYAKDLDQITQSASFERRPSLIIQAADGSTLARYGETKGKNLDVSELPPHLIHAVLAIEDRRFYDHPGIDIWGITRAMGTNVIKGRFVQGGSTITQQLAKNLFLTHQRKLTRKIQEAILAIQLERELTKDQILSAYMNRVYLGSGTYGFEAAAQLYFGKSAKAVTIHEAAILAGLLKAPSRYSPHNNPDKAKERAKIVLAAMEEAGFINRANLTDQDMRIALPNKQNKNDTNVRYFTDWVIDGISDIVGEPNIDMIVQTTLDKTLQNQAHATLKQAIDSADDMQFISQGAIITLRPDGAVLAMVGGYDYNRSQFNRVLQAVRPPGSAFKPFVYLSAIERGWNPSDKILDSPITRGEYRPKNFADQYFGTVDLETALAKSLNTATVRLAEETGIENILSMAKRLGIISPLQRDFSLALGSSGITVLEMATAYAVFANGGHRIYPYAITKITDKNGRILYQRKEIEKHQRLVRKSDIEKLSFMMQSVINNGTGKAAKLPYPAYGKTGTSQDSRDAWFAGYTNAAVSVVWLGNDDNSPMRKVTGSGLPALIWKKIMLNANAKYIPQEFISGNKQPPDAQNKDSGFSNMLQRLFANDNTAAPNHKQRNYSTLNE